MTRPGAGGGQGKAVDCFSENFNIRDFLHTQAMTEAEIDRCEFWISAHHRVKMLGKHNFQGEQILVNNKWNFAYLEDNLSEYKDKQVLDFFKYGWPLNASNTEILQTYPRNQAGARQNPDKLNAYLEEELKNGSIIGPFTENPFGREAKFSPLDTRRKCDSDELRVILNLSYPFEAGSVNHSIDKTEYVGELSMDVRYPTVTDLAELIRKKGKNCKIFRRDLRKAYRQMFLCPGSIALLGYRHEGKLYYDVTLSMGSKSAAFCCQMTMDVVIYIYKKRGHDGLNYLDDLGSAEVEEKAQIAFTTLGQILSNIGIEESENKAVAPSTFAPFLGIWYNTVTMTMSITPDRLTEVKGLLRKWIAMQSITKNEIQQILGKLNFISSTVRAGRVFVSRIINTLKTFPERGRRRMSEDMRKDLICWRDYMQEFDGKNIIPEPGWTKPDQIVSVDVCLEGAGGWNGRNYFHAPFPDKIRNNQNVSINELEAIALVLAVKK